MWPRRRVPSRSACSSGRKRGVSRGDAPIRRSIAPRASVDGARPGCLRGALPAKLGVDLLPLVVDLRTLAQSVEEGLDPLLPQRLDAARPQLVLLRFECRAV